MKKNKSTSHTKEWEHYMNVLVEEFQSRLDLVVEGIKSIKSQLGTEITDVRAEMRSFRHDMESQFSLVHAAIRCNADGIRELNTKMDRVSTRLDNHDERIGRIEKVS